MSVKFLNSIVEGMTNVRMTSVLKPESQPADASIIEFSIRIWFDVLAPYLRDSVVKLLGSTGL